MTAPVTSFLDGLRAAADLAARAEDDFRRGIAARIKALETERAFAFRRLTLIRALAEPIAAAESEETAIASAAAELRVRLGWWSDSEARSEVLSRFAPVVLALYREPAPEGARAERSDPAQALGEFEAWYAATHPVPFWVLFENVMPETPLVDF
jgi:hypothetical protein